MLPAVFVFTDVLGSIGMGVGAYAMPFVVLE